MLPGVTGAVSGIPISIIIPSRNEASGIAATIASAQSPQTLEILVVDAGRSDDAVEMGSQRTTCAVQTMPKSTA